MCKGALVSANGREPREQVVGLVAGGEQSTEVVEDDGAVAGRPAATVHRL